MKKKKIVSLICALSVMTSPQFTVVNAAGISTPELPSAVSETAYTETEADGVLYYVYDDHAEIAGPGKEKMPVELIIPETVSGKPVTKFADSYVFDSYSSIFNSSVKRFSLPDSMTELPENFQLPWSIEYFKFPAHMTEIPPYRIGSIVADEIVLPEDLTVLRAYSLYKVNAKKITIPAKTEKIERRAFGQVYALKDITILNPNCVIEDSPETIFNKMDYASLEPDYTGIIRGYKNSTTQEYAEKYGYRFIDFENPPAYIDPLKITASLPTSSRSERKGEKRIQFETLRIDSSTVEWGEFEFECEFNGNPEIIEKSANIFRNSVSLSVVIKDTGNSNITPYKITITKATDKDGNDISEFLPWKTKEYNEVPVITSIAPESTTTTTVTTTASSSVILLEDCTRVNVPLTRPYLTNEKGEELKIRAAIMDCSFRSPDPIDTEEVRQYVNECIDKTMDKITGKTDNPSYFLNSLEENILNIYNSEYAQKSNCQLVRVYITGMMLYNGKEIQRFPIGNDYPTFTLPTTAPVTTTGNKTTTTSGIKTTSTTAVPVTTSTVPFSSTTSESSATTTAPVTSSASTSVTTSAAAKATAGDSNGDGLINLKDVVLLRRYIAGGWNIVLDEKVADINRDGAVNLKDAVLLRRYIAGGWNVQLPQ